MGPTRNRDLTVATAIAAVLGFVLVTVLYRWFPPITVWTGLSLLAVGVARGGWGFFLGAEVNKGPIGGGAGWLHPLAVGRSVGIAQASGAGGGPGVGGGGGGP